jgi:hypothetical protein
MQRTCEEAKEQQRAAERFEDAADSNLGHQLGSASVRRHPNWEGKELQRTR